MTIQRKMIEKASQIMDYPEFTLVDAPIPVAPITHKRPKYPFEQMEVGQSFFVPAIQMSKANAATQCSKWSKRYSRVYRFALVGTDVQFWREA